MKMIHSLSHNGNECQEFKCYHCPFETRYRWVCHLECKLRSFRPGLCRVNIVRHLKTHGKGLTTVYKCQDCTFQTIHKTNFNTHVLRHKNPEKIKMFECQVSCRLFQVELLVTTKKFNSIAGIELLTKRACALTWNCTCLKRVLKLMLVTSVTLSLCTNAASSCTISIYIIPTTRRSSTIVALFATLKLATGKTGEDTKRATQKVLKRQFLKLHLYHGFLCSQTKLIQLSAMQFCHGTTRKVWKTPLSAQGPVKLTFCPCPSSS